MKSNFTFFSMRLKHKKNTRNNWLFVGCTALLLLATTAQAQNYTITTTGSNLVITDAAGNGDQLNVTQSGTGINFATAPARTYSLDGGASMSFPVAIPNLATFNTVTINAAGGADQVNITGFTSAMPNFTVNGGAGDLTFSGSLTNNAASARNLALNSDANITLSQSASGGMPLNTTVVATGNVTIGALGWKTNGGSLTSSGVNFNMTDAPISTSGGNIILNHATGNIAVLFAGIITNGGTFTANSVDINIGDAGLNTIKTGATGGDITLTSTGNMVIKGTGARTGGGKCEIVATGNVQVIDSGVSTCGDVTDGNFTSQGVDYISDGNGVETCGGNVTLTHTGNVTAIAETEGGTFSSTGKNFKCISSGIRTGKFSNIGGIGGSVTLNHAGYNITFQDGGVRTDGGTFMAQGVDITIGDGGLRTSRSGNPGGDVTITSTGNVVIKGSGTSTGGGTFLSQSVNITITDGGIFAIGMGSSTVTMNHSGNVSILSGGAGIQANGNISLTANSLAIGAQVNTSGGTVSINAPNGIFPTSVGSDVTGTTLSFAANSLLNISLNGTLPGNGTGSTYTQLAVVGAVNLTGLTLQLSGSFVPVVGQTFTIVNNDLSDAIIGTFNGLAEGASIPILGTIYNASITYMGGSNSNDVVITVLPADYTITTGGGNLVITDLSGNSDQLNVTQNGMGIQFATSPARTYSLDGAVPAAFPVTIASVATFNNITISTAAGNDVNNIEAFSAALKNLTVNGGTGDDAVNFNGDITFATDANLDVDLQNDNLIPGTDNVTVARDANLLLSGTGVATIKVSKNVLIDFEGSIETVNGNLSIEANQQATPTSGGFVGVSVTGGSIKTTGNGTLTVNGKGGDSGGGQYGVSVAFGKIEGGTAATSVQGTGGASTIDFNVGVFLDGRGGVGRGILNLDVYVNGTGAQITSSGGNVSVTGSGGGSGTSSDNVGVAVLSAGQITAGGSGTVTVVGNGGTAPTGDFNVGVFVGDTDAKITSSGGNVNVTGVEGGGPNGTGFLISNNGLVTTVPSGGNITIIANSMSIGFSTGVSTLTGNSVTLRPYTNGVQINLGSATDPIGGPFSLTDTELDRITTGTLNIGDANTGNITVSAAITRPASTVINLTTGSQVNLNAAALNSAGGNVNINAPNGTNPIATGTDINTGASSILDFTTGNDLNIAINGTTVDAQYNQLNVAGKVDITGVDLVFSGSFVPSACQQFMIVNNDGTDAIIGTFTGLAEGATLPNFRGSGLPAKISYIGGDGNDVVLRVISITPPCPTNMVRSNDAGQCNASVTYPTPTVLDNCSLPIAPPQWISGGTTPTASGANSISTFQRGATIVIWRATDGAGLTKTCTFRVTINDTQAPTLTCPAAMTLSTATNTCSTVATYANPLFTDNCAPTSGTSTRISGLASGSTFPVGNSNVVFQATDAAGNTRRCTMVVTVADNQAPAITCPTAVVVNGSGTPCKATVFYGGATASDNCAATLTPFLFTGLASGSSFPAGVTTNTFRAIAPNGQSSDCSFTVTVNCGDGMGNNGVEDRNADLSIQHSDNLELKLAPNPALSTVTVSIAGVGASGGTLLVFDAVGRLVLRQVIAENQQTAVFQVDDSAFAPGMYRVNLRTEHGMVTKTLVVVK